MTWADLHDAVTKERAEQRLCGVQEHEDLLKERDQLRAVLADLMQGRQLDLDATEVLGIERALRLLKEDGCYDCAFPRYKGNYGGHHHNPADRASSYRLLLGPNDGTEQPRKDTGNTVRSVLLRVLEVLVKAGPTK